LLHSGQSTPGQLAEATGAHAPSLLRLLRMLAGLGIVGEDIDGSFKLTELGDALRSDATPSVRDWALYVGAAGPWEAWGRLRDAVLTGEPGFALAHGMPTYQYLGQHPELAGPFDRWMTRQSEQHNAAIISAYDFSPHRKIADIGGGQGSTLAAILRAHPSTRGVLLDRPQVVADDRELAAAGVADRCEIVGGDMLTEVPAGADLYLIKRVLMILGDADAVDVLRRCGEVVSEEGRVMVVEMVMPVTNDPSPARSFDILMLLANKGGRIRTEAEFRELFVAAGLQLERVIATSSPNSLLVCSAV
jgi:ubiquinone/menaquinone biosynthesis C-methylase UbiE